MISTVAPRDIKGSDIAWIGDIPVHWSVVPFFSFADEVSAPNAGMREKNLLSLSYGRIVRKDLNKLEGLTPESFEGYNIVEANDIVFRLTDLQNDKSSLRSAMSPERGIITSAYVTARPRSTPRFFSYLMRSYDTSKVFYGIGGGIRQSMKYDDLKRLPVVLPDEDERERIADFLDRETARVDALIARKTRFIELLAEKRQALITHVVTRGLNPKAPSRDSRIDWLGKIPEHWLVAPFRTAVWFQEGPGIMAADFKDDGIPLLRVSGVQGRYASLEGCNFLAPDKVASKWSHFRVDKNDLLITASATTGTISEVDQETVGSIPYTGIIRLKPVNHITKEFLKAFVSSHAFLEQINLFKAGSTIQHYGPTHLSQMKIVLPPISEQIEIADYLERQIVRIEGLVNKTEYSIELLREHRATLITAAVTGKIDLRAVA